MKTSIPFVNEDLRPLAYGAGLDGRLRTDLSQLSSETLITPNDRFYVRTHCPDLIDPSKDWMVKVHGLVKQGIELDLESLARMSQPMGEHLLECAGNAAATKFGLLSVARWHGVPLGDVVKLVEPSPEAVGVLVSGFDKHSQPSVTSVPGASWVFTFADIKRTKAFLALGMNDEVLPKDHGFPVRLVVPGWYGCACIKWVDELIFVGKTEPATSQMLEYASRTHQKGTPDLAKDYKPASIEVAAMPIRVEKEDNGVYTITGIIWGGDPQTEQQLFIRFNAGFVRMPYEQVQNQPKKTGGGWSLWTHTWIPRTVGVVAIDLKAHEVPQRRLDSGYYVRRINVGT